MEQTVYADLYFMINFSMDFLCFYITSRLIGCKLSALRAAIASAIGGVYANILLLSGLSGIGAIAVDMLACALMCAVAFASRRQLRRLPLYTLVYLAVSMVLGGFMTAMFNLLNRTSLGGMSGSEEGISVWLFVALAAASALMTLAGGRFFRHRTSKKNVSLEITLGGRSVELTALCDSGNMLRDPISGKLCVIVSVDSLEDILPDEVISAVKHQGKNIGTLRAAGIGMRVIPARTAAGDAMLLAVRPEKISVEDGGRSYSVDALLALSAIDEISDGAAALFPVDLLI